MIRVADVSHHYGVRPVLTHVNFDVAAGESVVIMGPNGVGKSTLLGIIAGLMAPAKGYVEINGLRRRATEQSELDIRRQLVYLADLPWLPDFKTGREWLMAVGSLYDVDVDRLMDHLPRLLDLFHLSDKSDAPIRTYSHGQRKKLAICGALIAETPVLIMDEPFTGGLDAAAILALSRVLGHLIEQKKTTIIMTSQIGEMVEPLAHRLAILEGAGLKAYDTLDALRKQTGCEGPLSAVLEKLMHPQTLEQIESYLNRPLR